MRIQAPPTRAHDLEGLGRVSRPDAAAVGRDAPARPSVPEHGARLVAPDPWAAGAFARVALQNLPAEVSRLHATIAEVSASPVDQRRGPLTRLLSQARQLRRSVDALAERLDARGAAVVLRQLPDLHRLRDAVYDLSAKGGVRDPDLHALNHSLAALAQGALEAQTPVVQLSLAAPEGGGGPLAYVPDGLSHYQGKGVEVVRVQAIAKTPEEAAPIAVRVPTGALVAFEVPAEGRVDVAPRDRSELALAASVGQALDGPGRVELFRGTINTLDREVLITARSSDGEARYARYQVTFERREWADERARMEHVLGMD